MKKIFFLIAFAFVGKQSFSQIVILHVGDFQAGTDTTCVYNIDRHIIKVDEFGNTSDFCINCGDIGALNQELNDIASQGYKLVSTSSNTADPGGYAVSGLLSSNGIITTNGFTFIFAIP